MKIFRQIFQILLTAALLSALCICAFAAEGDTVTIDSVNYYETYEIVPQKPIYVVTESPDAKGDIVIPDEIGGIPVRRIEPHAFERNRGITSVTIGSNVTRIENSAFDGCRLLEEVTFGKSVSYIGYSAFYGCSELKTVALGNAITTVESNAFAHCSKLESAYFGIGLSRLYEGAFYDCESLRTISLPDDMTVHLNGVSEDLEFLPISGQVRTEVEELKELRRDLQEELANVEGEIKEDLAFLERVSGTASVFGEGNVTLIVIGAVCILAALGVGVLLGKKLPGKKKKNA